jgi:hypothetical protein
VEVLKQKTHVSTSVYVGFQTSLDYIKQLSGGPVGGVTRILPWKPCAARLPADVIFVVTPREVTPKNMGFVNTRVCGRLVVSRHGLGFSAIALKNRVSPGATRNLGSVLPRHMI